MKLVYTLKKIIPNQKSIFLAGGTYRTQQLQNDSSVHSWREQAITYLKQHGFNGTVYIPQFVDGKLPQGWTLDKQIKWQSSALQNSTIILFWIPRDLKNLPCFTTNFQLGQWYKSGKVVVGSPKTAQKNEYLQWKCKHQANLSWQDNLDDLVKEAIKRTK